MNGSRDLKKICPVPDRPLYIQTVRARFEALPPGQSAEIICHLLLDPDGTCKVIRFRIPAGDAGQSAAEKLAAGGAAGPAKPAAAASSEAGLAQRYFRARLNNLLVTFGGILLSIHFDQADPKVRRLIEDCLAELEPDRPRNNRTGSGSVINYINRINAIKGHPAFSVALKSLRDFSEPDPKNLFRLPCAKDREASAKILRAAAAGLQGKTFLGLDIGGNSIKGALVSDGRIALLKTYDWFPARFTSAEELIQPILRLTRSFAAVAPPFDAIVAGFPDIIVANKIAGGETYKQRGIRNHHPFDYERELARMAGLEEALGAFTAPGGCVKILNDGSLASFVLSVEQAFAEDSRTDEYGLFAFTIGTEMGTGYISRQGSILDLPLECYNYIIDLGNTAAARYPENDVRSIRNFNTAIAGTVQKYISQSGLIRLSCQNLAREGDAGLGQLLADGYLAYDPDTERLTVPAEPVDCRGALTRRLIGWLAAGNASVRQAYEEIGHCLGVVIDEIRCLFPELAPGKFVSGGLVNEAACFEILSASLSRYNPDYPLWRLDTAQAYSPLLKSMDPQHANYLVAVGAAFLGNMAKV